MLNKLFFIKSAHTAIFIFMWACLLYLLYCAITGTYNLAMVIAVAAIFIEGLALLLNRWKCPLTTFAERHGAENGSVTDIFLPQWMTHHVFGFATVLFAVEIIVLSLRYFLG